ncbi:MAG: hypothetical protein JSS87_01750 [Acidobacteria bacterium]|nr:hypothetical protein [Acidobacteriota bacterium]
MDTASETITIQISGKAKDYVEEHVASGRFASAEEYVASLVQEAQIYETSLKERLLGALESPSIDVPEELVGKPEMLDWLEAELNKRQTPAA